MLTSLGAGRTRTELLRGIESFLWCFGSDALWCRYPILQAVCEMGPRFCNALQSIRTEFKRLTDWYS